MTLTRTALDDFKANISKLRVDNLDYNKGQCKVT